MDEHTLYLTLGYALMALLIAIELVLLRAKGKKILQQSLIQRDD